MDNDPQQDSLGNKSGFYEQAPVALHGSDNPGAAAGQEQWYQLLALLQHSVFQPRVWTH